MNSIESELLINEMKNVKFESMPNNKKAKICIP